MHHLVTSRPQLFIAHNSADVIHWGEVGVGQNISTGQPSLELFEVMQRTAWDARLLALGVDRVALEAEAEAEAAGVAAPIEPPLPSE